MSHFFSVYKSLENKDTVVDEVKDADEAIKIIISCIENYNNCFDENGNKKVDAE